MVVVQIAGLIARGSSAMGPGDRVHIGQTYGLVRYGSRLTPTCRLVLR